MYRKYIFSENAVFLAENSYLKNVEENLCWFDFMQKTLLQNIIPYDACNLLSIISTKTNIQMHIYIFIYKSDH